MQIHSLFVFIVKHLSISYICIAIYPTPCLDYPHRLQGRFAALLVLYAYVIICRSTNVCICTRRCCYRKCTQFVSYITYESTYIIQLEYSSHVRSVYTLGEISLYLIGRSWLIPEGYFMYCTIESTYLILQGRLQEGWRLRPSRYSNKQIYSLEVQGFFQPPPPTPPEWFAHRKTFPQLA